MSMATDSESQLLQLCTDGNLPALKDLITMQGLNPNEVKDPSGLTLLHLACQHGHLDTVQYLIKDQKCNPETTTPNGRTPLHVACKLGHLHIVKCLITDHKCNPHCTDNDGYTPLHAASESGNIKTVKYLITEQGSDPQVGDSIGNTPLHYASESGHLNILQYLIIHFHCNPKQPNNRGSTPLHYACSGGQTAITRYLIKEHQCNPNHTNNYGNTSLHLACLNGQLAMVLYLIDELGCNPQIYNKYGCSPLHYAWLDAHLDISKFLILECLNNRRFVVKYLITEHKCGPEHVNGYTPLHSAASNGNLAVVKHLISDHGCNPQITDNNGLIPLHYACLNGHFHIIKYFICNCNCNPQYSAKNGSTPLHFACEKGHLEVAKYLITEHKCSPEHGNVDGITPLHSAASSGHLAVVKYLISELGCIPQISAKDGLTPLHCASLNGHLDVMKYLISDCNCNPQCSNNNGFTPLLCACEKGHLEVAKYLITEHKCSPEHGNVNGYTPLHSAASNGHLAVVKYLINKFGCIPQISAKDGLTPLHCASLNGHLDVIKYLISDCNCKPQCSNNNGFTPLHCACGKDHLEVAKYLITEHKCSPEHGNVNGITPLHSAAGNGHLAVVKYLINKFGCNPQISAKDGLTPLHCASLNGHLDVIKYLISDCNCKPQCSNNNGFTPLHFACEKGHLEVAKYLITEHKCSPEHGNVNGITPLHSAASSGHLAVVKYLINKFGCNPQISAKDGLTPLHCASLNSHLDVIKHLISDCNCKPQCSNNNGFTPLHCACEKGHLEVAKYLITEHKCSPEHGNVNGITPLHSAASNGHLAVVKYLIHEENCPCKPVAKVYKTTLAAKGMNECFILDISKAIEGLLFKSGITPLHSACMKGHLDIVKYLISECNCNPNDSNSNHGFTVIDFAQMGGQQEIVNYLRNEHQCNSGLGEVLSMCQQACCNIFGVHCSKLYVDYLSCINFNDLCISPLQQACFAGNLEAVKISITKSDCNPSSTGFLRLTPLHTACMMGHLEIVKYLVTGWKCDPNCAVVGTAVYLTPFTLATLFGHLEVVEWLISEQKCKPECNIDGNSIPIIHIVCMSGQLNIMKYLLSECSYQDLPDLLLFACVSGHLNIVKYLIEECECDPHSTDDYGVTILHLACIGIHGFLDENVKEHHTFEPTMSAPSKLSKPQLIWRKIIFPVTLASQIFHKFVQKKKKKSSTHDITGNTVSSELQPTAYCYRYHDTVKYLITEQKCNPQCTDSEGQTPLHYACANGQHEIVQYFYKENLSDLVHTSHSGDTPLHFACEFNQVEVVQYLLSTGECDPLIKNAEGMSPLEIATSPEIRKLLDQFCKREYPLESVVKVFVIGDPKAGKSSLVRAIQSNPGFVSSLFGRFQKVKGVRQQTAGIDSFTFASRKFGNVVIYDFAGQQEYYTSHAAFLQNASCMPGIFVVVTNVAQHEDKINQSVKYWVSFIHDCCAHMHTETTPPIIIIGSHTDQLKGDVKQTLSIIENFSGNSDQFYKIERTIGLDCTRPFYPGMDILRNCLEKSCNFIRDSADKIDQRCYVLSKYLHNAYIKTGTHGSTLEEISKDLEENQYLLPSNPIELLPLLQTLHDKGQILLLRNKYIPGDSWVITNVAALLETVVGSIFAPRDFPQHIAPGSTGIVPKSGISGAFRNLNIDMVIGFLEHFEFCHRVSLDWVGDRQSNQALSDDEYYLFPVLLTSDSMPQVLQESHKITYCCGWLMCSAAEGQFFTTRFLHVLLLRLAFLFAPPQDETMPSSKKIKAPVLSRRCSMRKNGISWQDTNGVRAVFEMKDLKIASLKMICPEGREIHCVRLRTKLIGAILKAKNEFCPNVHVEECIVEVAADNLQMILDCPSHGIKYLSRTITNRDPSDDPDLILTHSDGSTGMKVSELLYFEPYAVLTPDLITQLFAKQNVKKKVPSGFVTELASCMYPFRDALENALKPDPSVLSRKYKEVHPDSLGEISRQQLRCQYILEAWLDQLGPAATYKTLRQELNKYSIFCGRNPLNLVSSKH